MPTLISETNELPVCGWLGAGGILLESFTRCAEARGLEVRQVGDGGLDAFDYFICCDLDSGNLLENSQIENLRAYCQSHRGKAIYCSLPEFLPLRAIESALNREAWLLSESRENGWDLRLVRVRGLILEENYRLQSGVLAKIIERIHSGIVPQVSTPVVIKPYAAPAAADSLLHVLFSRGDRQSLVELIGAHGSKLPELLDDLATELSENDAVVAREPLELSDPIPGLVEHVLVSNTFKRQELIDKMREIYTPPSTSPAIKSTLPSAPPQYVAPLKIYPKIPRSAPPSPKTPITPQIIAATEPKAVIAAKPLVVHRPQRSFRPPSRLALGVAAFCLLAIMVVSFPLLNLSVHTIFLRKTPKTPSEMVAAYNQTESLRRDAVLSLRRLDPLISRLPGLLPKLDQWVEKRTLAIEWNLLKSLFEVNVASIVTEIAKDNGDPATALKTARADLERLYQFSIENAEQPAVIGDQIYRERLPSLRQLLDVLPVMLKFSGQTNLLFLLQNNLELRPSGGFLSEVGMVQFDRGRIFASTFKNAYQLDAELRGHVDPPAEIATLLGEENWYLRDANWDPHFPTSAINSAWFAQKETGKEYQSVIGINLLSLQALLQETGQLTLVDGSTITAANLLNRALSYKELGAGEALKSDFMTQIVTALGQQFLAADPSLKAKVIFAFVDAANSGQFTLYAEDAQARTILQELGWTGGVIEPACPTSFKTRGCYIDTLYVNEANVGINKTNYYLTRSHHHQITLSATGAKHSHQITLLNTAQSETWPAGKYKAFIRWYLPSNAKLTSINQDRTPVASTQYAVKNEQGRKVVSLLVEIAPSKQLQLRLEYEVSRPIPEGTNYTFFMQKQPGTGPDPLTIAVVAPEYHLTPATPNFNATQTVQYQGSLKEHFFGAFELSK